MKARSIVRFSLVFVALLVNAPLVTAGFATYSKNWPDDASVVGEDQPAKDEDNNTEASDLALANKVADTYVGRISEDKRLYLKFGGNLNNAQVRTIRNYSYNALAGKTLTTTSVRKNYLSWEVGLGTKYKALRYELEYIYTKNFTYNPSPIFIGRSESLSSTVMNTSIWLNVIYDFKDFNNFNFKYCRPYVGVLGGFTWNKTRSTMTGGVGNGAPKDASKLGITWGVNLGLRAPFWTRWMGYFGYRITKQPKVRWTDNSNVLYLRGKYFMSGFNFGVNYII